MPKFNNPFVVAAFTVIVLLAFANIQITQNITTGTPKILGESEEQKKAEEAAKEAEKKAQEAQKESSKKTEEEQKKQQEQQKEEQKEQKKEESKTPENTTRTPSSSGSSVKTKTESVSTGGVKIKKEGEGRKQETEIQTADGQKIKTKIEDDGTTKIEIENGSLKLKYRTENGKVILKAENESGKEVELDKDQLEELENAVKDELEDDDLKLVPTTNNRLAVAHNQVAVVTDFPLSINVETKELIVTTPSGQKVVTVLPEQAVENLLATNIINTVETSPTDSFTQGQLGALSGVVKLEIRNDEVIYKVNGTKTYRMLGFIPVTTPVTALVSAENGTTVAKQQSLLANVIDLLSP